MEVSVVWLGLILIGIALLFLFTQAKGVYDTFIDYEKEELTEGFIVSSKDDIHLTSCPADYKQFINNDGISLCCDGESNAGRCSGRTICSLSEKSSGIPTCSTWYSAYLDEKGRNKCPPSLPNYFETRDGKLRGCTSGKRKPDGSGPLDSKSKFCKLYTSKRDDEGKVDSCTNVMLLDKTVCFPGSSIKVDKSIVSVQGGQLPAQIKCIFPSGSCISNNSFDRYYTALFQQQGKEGFRKETFTRIDPLEKLNLCSISQKYYINKTISFQDLPYVNYDGTGKAPLQQGGWKCIPGISVPLRKNANGDTECMSTNGRNCMWQGNDSGCRTLLSNAPLNMNPLSCGDTHKRLYGTTGYEDKNHWCSRGKQQL